MIKSLNHLPHPHENAQVLASHFTDLAPPLSARQAVLESSRCLYCYDAPCVNACPSDIDIPSFIRNIQQENVQGAAQKILSANILGGSCARVCPTEVLCQQALMRHQPGVRPRPGAGHTVDPFLGEVFKQEVELVDVVCHHNQALDRKSTRLNSSHVF